ncbi:MAG: aldehyde dehydrogenase family protein [Gemmatimonadota bacterium]|jgi:succinate-semialdehyde dehydrogenase/glutarate-semialdehyde dehydrogenase
MSGPALQVRMPSDGSLVAELPVQDADEVRAAVGRARAAQVRWAALSPGERARRLRPLARVLRDRADEISERIRAETSKPGVEAVAEVLVSADLIRFYAKAAPRHLRPRRVRTGWVVGKSAWVEKDPYGVVGAITPWNYPFILAMDSVIPALFAGNAVVVKPSEITPWTTTLLPSLCRDAGLPDGLVEVVTGDGSTGRALVESGVDRIVFTGSTATGRKIMEAAAATLTPVTLELGGKDPAIVLEDANLERAAQGVTFGAFFNCGQTCIAVERAFVVRSVYDDFVNRVTRLAAALRFGTGPDADVGPMVSAAQVRIVEDHVCDAVDRGARVVVGGRRPEPDAQAFLPTVLVDVTPEMKVMREESFGPLLPIMAVDDVDEAVRLANVSGYGLFASVWTGNRKRGAAVARRLHAGGVSVNDVLSHYGVAGLPMGGRGDSGFGRRRGVEALDEMSRTRTMLSDRLGMKRDPWWFPYGATGRRIIRAALDLRGVGGLRGVLRATGRIVGRDDPS